VNEKLRLGRYFFMDIVREGILLFEEPGFPFVEPQPLSPAEALRETQEYFEEWFESAARRLELAQGALAKGYLNEAAFDFHQAAERFYHCLFLVRTLYSPKTHNLNGLAARHQVRAALLRTAPRGLCEGALLSRVLHQRRAARMAFQPCRIAAADRS
jgi:HEPN domain-containing protein